MWQKSFTPSPAPFDALIREALIEQRAITSGTTSGDDVSRWDKDAHSLLWLLANDLDLVFCVAYQRILALPYVADLLHATRDAFLKPYRNAIHAIVASTSGKDTDALRTGPSPAARAIFGREADAAWSKAFKGWDDTFNRILREFEASSSRVRRCSLPLLRLCLSRARATHPSSFPKQIRTRSRTAALAEAQHASSPSSSASEATSCVSLPFSFPSSVLTACSQTRSSGSHGRKLGSARSAGDSEEHCRAQSEAESGGESRRREG